MKTKIKRVSRSTLAVILAIMMVFSTMLVGTISVNAVNNGDDLYLFYDTESNFENTSIPMKSMNYSNSVYTTILDFTGVSNWTWYLLSISSSSSDRTPQWSSFPTVNINTSKFEKYETGSRGSYKNLVKFNINGNASSGTSNYVKVTYNLTQNTITFDPSDSGTKTYSVINNATDKVTVDEPSTGLSEGAEVTIRPTDSNKKITAATITDALSNIIHIVPNDSDGTATFTMPASNVTISDVTLADKTTSTKEWNKVALIGGTLNGNSIGDWSSDSSYEFTYNAEDDTWYSDPIEFTGATNAFKARVNGDWNNNPSFGNGVVSDNQEGNFTEELNGTYIFYVKDGASVGEGLKYKQVSSEDTVTVNSKLNVTDGSGNTVLTATTNGTETSATVSGSTITLTASDTETNYNFAGWKLDGVTLTSGTTASKTISFTINSGAENPTVTATAITLTPRLDVSTTSLVLNDTKTESVTLHAYSKVGDKTLKAKYYTVTYYYDFTSEDGATTTTKIVADTKYITVTDDDYANMSSADATKYLIGGIKNVDYTFTPSARGTYVFYADIQGYDKEGEDKTLVTGDYAELSLGTSLGKDGGSATVTVTDGTFKLPIADSDDYRLFAYATTLAEGATPNADAWVAADSKSNQYIYGNSEKKNGPVVAYPSIGSASANSFNVYLPSSASATEVVLYNNYTTTVTVTGSDSNKYTIDKGAYAAVPYTSGSALSYTVSGNTKSLTVYRSTAEGALYLNNTADFSSNSDVNDKSVIDSSDNVPNMIKQLYSDKETGAVSGCSGATALGSDIEYVNIKKIKGRGNTTWNYTDKKSFNVTFKSDLVDTKFGKKFEFKGAKYSLLANYKEPSLARNEILYTLADEMGVTYSPNTAVIDLYMNGLYMGTYLMSEKIEVGKKELISDISASLYKDDTTSANGFSFLMELDTNASPEDYSFSAEGEQVLTIKEPEAGTDFTTTYIKARYKELIDALNDQTMTTEELNEIIDVESLAKYFLLNELAKNCDIGVSSTYFVYKYDATSNTGKFYASPLWDMDMTAANGDKNVIDNDYVVYTGNWSYKNNSLNRVIKAAFNNSNVQAKARSIWTEQYGIKLIETINTLGSQAYSKIGASYTMNFTKWSKPYGFNGGYNDNIQARKNLTPATYTAGSGYKELAAKTYDEDAGQIKFVTDWLTSRAAWLTQKYNTYYISGTAVSGGWGAQATLSQNSNGIYTYELPAGTGIEFKICTDGGLEGNTEAFGDGVVSNAYRDKYATSISMNASIKNGANLINSSNSVTALSVNSSNNITYTSSSNVYLIYNQNNNTVTLSDTITTITKPSVVLTGTEITDNDKIVQGTTVTLTATVTPATKDGNVLTGTYTVDLYRDGSKVTGQSNTVTFADGDTTGTTKDVSFTTALVGKSQSYTVKVSYTYTEGATTLTGDSAAVEYKQAGLKDQKIYFDPSTWYENDNVTSTWKKVMTTTSTVTVTVSGSGIETETFTMSIDTDDIHGFDKGVFVANITAETLAKLQNNSNNITFTMVGTDDNTYTAQTTGDENIKSGWIYNYTNEQDKDGSGSFSKRRWEAYNVAYNISYPNSDIKSYDDFKKYLADQVSNDTNSIIYFDNSASQWYNVYLYTWDASGNYENCVQMTKLPYADIWYYDFGESMRTERFLFKDRGDRGFGSDFQQTVDLVDGFVKDAAGTQIPINYTYTLSKVKNPIFITDKFEKITEQNGGGYLKFRAFNTQWQEFNEVVLNAVQTKAVDIYFDLHGDANTNPATMSIYHESTTKDYKFSSPSTTLTKLPGSTIYYARLNLPYTDAGELMFKFTRFVAGNSIDKTMGDNAQPEFKCINTGEVWYEYAPSGITYGNAEATSILSAKSADDPASVGANETNDSVAANTITVYFAPGNSSNTWVNSTTDLTGRTFKCNVQGGNNDSNQWWSVDMVDTGKTIDNNKVYSATITYNDSGLYNMQFQKYNNSSFEDQVVPFANSWTTTDTMNGKFWNGSSWATPNWDSVSEIKDLYLFGANFNGWSDNFNYKEYKLAYNETSDTYSITVDIAKLKDYFAIHDTSKQYSSTGADDSSNTNRFITALNEEKSLTESNVAFKYTGDETGDVVFNVSGDLTKVWLSSVTTPTPTITINAASTNLTLSNGLASTQLTVNTENAGSPTVSYSISKNGVSVEESIASVDGENKFTATQEGTYVVTATINVGGTDYYNTVTIIVKPTPTITINAASTNLTLSNGSASTQLTVNTEYADSATVSYSISPSTGASVDADTKTFTATAAGTYVVTATINFGGTDYYNTVTITVNPASTGSTTEYCGVLGYNHSTATFTSTVGGIIKDAYVNLINGYQNNTTAIKTGYTTVTDGVYTVIYALTSTGALAETAKTNNVGVTESTSDYEFNGWLKDNQPILGTGDNKNYTYSEEVSGTSTVEYVASWSKLLDKIYKFTYKYLDYNKAEYGIEYAGKDGTVKEALTLLNDAHTTYTINVNLPGNASVDDIKNAYINRAPKLQSDYFIYSFDINAVTVNEDALTAEAVANLDSVKKYKVTFTDDYKQNANVFYQNIVTLTVSEDDKASLTSDKTLKWTDRYGNTLFIGNTYTFRVTKDVTVSYEFIDKTETINSTYVNEPTYEFYTTNTGVEKIRFNIRVDNIVAKDTTVAEYGIIRFLTDENGKPLDSTVSQDKNISKDTLISLVQNGGNASVTVYKIKKEAVNEEKKYIYAPSMTNNAANREKYMRVFSYIKTSDGTIVVSDNSVIVSIKNAI